MSDIFTYHNNQLHIEQVPLAALAKQFGTPAYVYSRAAITQTYQQYANGFGDFPHLICYAVKANSNLAVLNILARLGAGFDIVSVGELERVLLAGGDPKKIVFSGVGKTAPEMARALEVGIHCFNVESAAELKLLAQVAKSHGATANVSLRVNPDVDAKTHPYISTGLRENKFGIATSNALALYQEAATLQGINVVGIDCHIGSQLTQLEPFSDALDRVLALLQTLTQAGITLKHLDFGGGLGICYRTETPPTPGALIEVIKRKVGKLGLSVLVEPGRSIVGNAGVLLTQVLYKKTQYDRHFAIVDAAMNDLIRPALYQAWMDIKPVTENPTTAELTYDVVGPVCETGDFLGKERQLKINDGDVLAVMSAGAYGFVMSSNYNTRSRSVEILVDGDKYYVVRERESFADLIRGESMLPV